MEASTSLVDIIGNTLVLHQIAPYLPVPARLALAATCKQYRQLLYDAPQTFRHLDLSYARVAALDTRPIDSGGHSWRAQRMDEALTEDEFYSGPLRGFFSVLEKHRSLRHVQTMILDGLSVPADLIQEIISSDRFNVRILSIREARHLNDRKLMQVLRYAVRPTRPEGTPKLKGLYVFGPRDEEVPSRPEKVSEAMNEAGVGGVMSAEGAQIGVSWNQRSHEALQRSIAGCDDRWYQPVGRMVKVTLSTEWADTIRACEGIVAFDAVVCRGPRHNLESTTAVDYSSSEGWLPPAVANVALGPSGCLKCGTSEEGPARYRHSSAEHLPLLSPPPLHSSAISVAQKPSVVSGTEYPPLFVRCEDCLRGRWCERCNKSWCSNCFAGQELGRSSEFGVARDCFDCGRTCSQCRTIYTRVCKKCRTEYCIVDNEGSTEIYCDWCSTTGRRHTREPY